MSGLFILLTYLSCLIFRILALFSRVSSFYTIQWKCQAFFILFYYILLYSIIKSFNAFVEAIKP